MPRPIETTTRSRRPSCRHAAAELRGIVRWYLASVYRRWEGPGTLPFWADTSRVGAFAVPVGEVAARDPQALFRLLIALASYQSRRDVDIMAIQRDMPKRRALDLTSPRRLKVLVDAGGCAHLDAALTFDQRCDVRRTRLGVSCGTHPRTPCHVKAATAAIGRMGDMGKMSTSAWLHLGPDGFDRWLGDACETTEDPVARAALLVARFSTIYRIGRKLASMFVSAVSVPELTGISAWHPSVDGSRVLVIDGNVIRAINTWRPEGTKTYAALSAWLLQVASAIDLSHYDARLPRRCPRLVQQAIYVFGSRSNRLAQRDPCAARRCSTCPSRVCPFSVAA